VIAVSDELRAEIRRLLRCPVHPDAELSTRGEALHCARCGRAYSMRDGIGVLLADQGHGPDPVPAGDTTEKSGL